MKTRNSNKQYFVIVALLSLAIAVTIRFPMILNILFSEGSDRHPERFGGVFFRFMAEMLITYVVAFLMFTMNFFIIRPVEKQRELKIPNIILSIILTVISVFILNHLLFSLSNTFDPQPFRPIRQNEFELTNFFVSALVIGCVFIIRLIFQKQNFQLENESLKREALQSQFESLKNQLSPHFLFNSLTALKILIQEAPDKAQNYVNSLSLALRYTLQSNEKKLVSLQEEMEFIDSYLFLIRIRFDSNLSVNIKIEERLLGHNLPPLTIQTLVENAIKHNEISKKNPLRIDILTTKKETLLILNPIQKKFTEEEGTGIGLSNLSKQFQLLNGNEINIRKENNQFLVEIPLIKP
jgi:uncharacterized membrane-anchored protein YhcB (DUF1043 family)